MTKRTQTSVEVLTSANRTADSNHGHVALLERTAYTTFNLSAFCVVSRVPKSTLAENYSPLSWSIWPTVVSSGR
jgi:hypothetical protein